MLWLKIRKMKIVDKVFKITICLAMVLLMNLSLKPKHEAHAVLPQIALQIVKIVAAEVAVDLGWKYIGKPAYDKAMGKVIGKINGKYGSFDFGKKKPKKKGKYLEVDVSPKDRAKIGTILKEVGEEVIEADGERRINASKPKYDVDYKETDPFYKTSVSVSMAPYTTGISHVGALAFFQSLFNVTFKPLAYKSQTEITFTSAVTGGAVGSPYPVYGGTTGNPVEIVFKTYSDYSGYGLYAPNNSRIGGVDNNSKTIKVWQSYLSSLENNNRTIYIASGLLIPEDNTKIYKVPLDTPDDYKLPDKVGQNKPIKIPIPAWKDDPDDLILEMEWSEIDNDSETYIQAIQEYEVTVSNKWDTDVTNNYDVVINNNYYYADDEKEVIDIENDINISIDNSNNNNNDNDGSGGGQLKPVDDIDVPKSFFKEMYEMGQKVEDMYDGVVHFFKTATDGFVTLTTGMTGFVLFLDEFFDWLPDEYRTLLGAGFALGVVSFFLRR